MVNRSAARLGLNAAPPQRLNEDQIAAIVNGLGSLLAILREADPRDKAELYSSIGLRMTYQPGREMIKAEIVSDDLGRVLSVCPGSTQTNAQRSASLSTTIALP